MVVGDVIFIFISETVAEIEFDEILWLRINVNKFLLGLF